MEYSCFVGSVVSDNRSQIYCVGYCNCCINILAGKCEVSAVDHSLLWIMLVVSSVDFIIHEAMCSLQYVVYGYVTGDVCLLMMLVVSSVDFIIHEVMCSLQYVVYGYVTGDVCLLMMHLFSFCAVCFTLFASLLIAVC